MVNIDVSPSRRANGRIGLKDRIHRLRGIDREQAARRIGAQRGRRQCQQQRAGQRQNGDQGRENDDSAVGVFHVYVDRLRVSLATFRPVFLSDFRRLLRPIKPPLPLLVLHRPLAAVRFTQMEKNHSRTKVSCPRSRHGAIKAPARRARRPFRTMNFLISRRINPTD